MIKIKIRNAGILLIIQVLFFSLYGQNVEISGNAPAYKGEKIEFFLSPNPIIHVDEPVGECLVDSEGDFFCKLNIKKKKPAEYLFLWNFTGVIFM